MADCNTKITGKDESIDEIVLICDNDLKEIEPKESTENEFLKKLSLTGFKNEKFVYDLDKKSQIDSIQNINLNDTNLPKDNPKIKKKEHNGIPFNRTCRPAMTQFYCNKENNSNNKNRVISSLNKLKPLVVKQQNPSQVSAGNPKNTNSNFRVPLSVKSNSTIASKQATKDAKIIPRLTSYVKPKPATMPHSPKLSTSIRAEERNRYNMQLKERENLTKLQKQKENETKEKDSSKKLEILRKNLIHKPEPIRKYHP